MTLATCLGCGCTCDDIDVRVSGNRIVDARSACPLGLAWFGDGVVPVRVLVDGREATLDAALDAAVRLLDDAQRPAVYLAADLSCETQREGIAIADGLRARLDSLTSSTAMASLLAAQELGRATATLGEIRNRADVLLFWGVDPAERYPRFWTRYAPEPAGVHVAGGRRSRTVIAVDVGESRGPADADLRVAISPDQEVEVLTRLRARIVHPDSDRLNPLSRPVVTGPDPDPTRHRGQVHFPELLTALTGGRYVAVVADAEPEPTAAPRDPGRASALIALTQALNATTRCALSTLRAGGNRSGADAVLTSQTGYPAAVDFSRGYPRYRPYDGAARGGRSDADAVLVLGSAAAIPASVIDALRGAASVVIGPNASAGPLAAAAVVVDTGVAGIHEGGTAFRMDDVPLPLSSLVSGPPSTFSVTHDLRDRVRLRASRRREVPA